MKQPIRKHRPYEARVEFLALKEEIDRLRQAGHSARAIFDELKNDGHLSMSYASFCRYIQLTEGRKSKKKEVNNIATLKTLH